MNDIFCVPLVPFVAGNIVHLQSFENGFPFHTQFCICTLHASKTETYNWINLTALATVIMYRKSASSFRQLKVTIIKAGFRINTSNNSQL
jgi:hypothetical protein